MCNIVIVAGVKDKVFLVNSNESELVQYTYISEDPITESAFETVQTCFTFLVFSF